LDDAGGGAGIAGGAQAVLQGVDVVLRVALPGHGDQAVAAAAERAGNWVVQRGGIVHAAVFPQQPLAEVTTGHLPGVVRAALRMPARPGNVAGPRAMRHPDGEAHRQGRRAGGVDGSARAPGRKSRLKRDLRPESPRSGL
jgi:hypothetical protein